MPSCPRCQTGLPPGPSPDRCPKCGTSLGSATTKSGDGDPERWEPSKEKPVIGAAVDDPGDKRGPTTGELLRSLLTVASTRHDRLRPGQEPLSPAALYALDADDDVKGTRAYGSGAAPRAATGVALANVSMGSEPSPPEPAGDVESGLIARSLQTLCTRVRAREKGPACVVDLLTLVASADGVIDDGEMDALTLSLAALLGGARRPPYMRLLIQGSVDAIHKAGAAETMLGIAEVLSECDAAEEGVVMAIAIAYASYGMCAPERAAIRALAGVAGVGWERCEDLIRRVRAEVDPAWEAVQSKKK